jgi:DNA-binding response OmpR family regulator
VLFRSVCEGDPAARAQVLEALQAQGYRITEVETSRDALKKPRFHVYDLVVLNERFGTDNPDVNDLMTYFSALPMTTRRQMFIVLLSDRFRTMDNMAAFNKSVNLIVNLKNMADFTSILKKGLSEHTAFYHIFKDTLRKMGKM